MTDAEAIDELRRKFGMCPNPRISTPERVLEAVEDAILEASSWVSPGAFVGNAEETRRAGR